MRKIISSWIILGLLSFSCTGEIKYIPEGLTKVSKEEMLVRAANFNFPDVTKITFKNESGEIILRDSLMKIQNPQDFAQDYYQNSQGQITETIIRKGSAQDKSFHQKLLEVINDGPELKTVEIDCADKVNFLQNVFEKDQEIRRKDRPDRRVDHENLELITNFLDKCGMPTLSEVDEVQMAAIWAVLQHSSKKHRIKYMPILEEAAKKGDIGWGTIVMMKDRNLMDDGKPQLYGTQINRNLKTGNWELYQLAEPESVNKRRKEMGMEPIQEYLKRWDINFDVLQTVEPQPLKP